MKKILPIILFAVYCLLFTLVFPSPVKAQGPPAEQHPDINLAIRGYEQMPCGNHCHLIEGYHPPGLDDNGRAPQLTTLIENEARPAITSRYQVYHWDWIGNRRGPLIKKEDYNDPSIPEPLTTLIGLRTTSGQAILVPDSGYGIGGGYEALVLFATPTSMTLKYTGEDDMVSGYGLHLENFTVDSEILSIYNDLNDNGRKELPALLARCKIGVSAGSEIRVAVRDTGSFMDPLWENDWWANLAPATAIPECIPEPMIVRTEGETIILDNDTPVRSVWRVFDEDTVKATTGSERTYTEKGPGHGKVFFNEATMPGLTDMAKNYVHAFWALLSGKRAEKASLDSKRREMKSITYPIPLIPPEDGEGEWQPDNTVEVDCRDGQPQDDEDVSKETVSLASSWSLLVSALTGIPGMIKPASRIADLALYEDFRYQLPKEDWQCGHYYSFGPGPIKAPRDLGDPADNKETFRVPNLITLIIEFFKDIDLFITKKEKGVEMRANMELPGGGYAIRKSKELALSITPEKTGNEFKMEGEAKQLAGELTTDTGLSPGATTTQPLFFAGQVDTWWAACSGLCTAHPENRVKKGMHWVGSNKICPSCDPEDYEIEGDMPKRTPCKNPDGTPNWDKNPQDCAPDYCVWNFSYHSCDYGAWCNPNNSKGYPVRGCPEDVEPQIEPGCGSGEDPVCEECKGLPNTLYPDTDLAWCGGAGGPKSCIAHPCQILNHTNWENAEYNDPAYNGCYYANDGVKVRRDFVGCDGVCNDACPAY